MEAALEDDPNISSAAFPWVTGFGLLSFGVLAVAVTVWSEKRTPDPRPNPGIFTMPTMPAAPPPARATVTEPGRSAFEEGYRRLVAGDAAGAVASLGQAVADAPDDAQCRNMYAKALLAAGSVDEALAQFDAALRLSPENVGYLSDAARALDRAGRVAEAARAYQAILDRQPQHQQALHDLSSLHQRSGRFDLALPMLRQLTEARPGDLALRQELAYALEKTGDVKAASEQYEKVLSEVPGADATRTLLAEMRFQQGERNEAITMLRDGLARGGEAPLLHRGLGSLLERTGAMAEAVKEYREYARLAPNAPDAKQLADRADQLEQKIAAANSPPS